MPWWLLLVMMVVSLVTTYLAVYFPISKVNKVQIANVIKGNA